MQEFHMGQEIFDSDTFMTTQRSKAMIELLNSGQKQFINGKLIEEFGIESN